MQASKQSNHRRGTAVVKNHAEGVDVNNYLRKIVVDIANRVCIIGSMEILFGLATIYLLSLAFKVAHDDHKYYAELHRLELTNEKESV